MPDKDKKNDEIRDAEEKIAMPPKARKPEEQEVLELTPEELKVQAFDLMTDIEELTAMINNKVAQEMQVLNQKRQILHELNKAIRRTNHLRPRGERMPPFVNKAQVTPKS